MKHPRGSDVLSTIIQLVDRADTDHCLIGDLAKRTTGGTNGRAITPVIRRLHAARLIKRTTTEQQLIQLRPTERGREVAGTAQSLSDQETLALR